MKPLKSLSLPLLLLFLSCQEPAEHAYIMTVKGPVPTQEMGFSLIHEHVLVDFIGADSTHESRWDKAEVVHTVLPHLRRVQAAGCQTFFECTPAYLGRDPLVLKALADSTGMHIITNTGYYGAVDNKFLPDHAYTESAEELAARWIDEWEKGIGETGIKPGFIKISVNPDSLSELHQKLVKAAALTHLATGLTVASHTGLAVPAFEEIEILKSLNVAPEAFIWVHAQMEEDVDRLIEAAKLGAWISLDNIRDENMDEYLEKVVKLKEENLLHKVLLSHDAGWYRPGVENGGPYRDHMTILEDFIPLMRENGFMAEEIKQLFVENPVEAFQVRVR